MEDGLTDDAVIPVQEGDVITFKCSKLKHLNVGARTATCDNSTSYVFSGESPRCARPSKILFITYLDFVNYCSLELESMLSSIPRGCLVFSIDFKLTNIIIRH